MHDLPIRVTPSRATPTTLLALLFAAVSTLACGAQPPAGGPDADATPSAPDTAAAAAELLVSGAVQLVDLTHSLSPDSIYWPTGSPFTHERLEWGVNEQGLWYAAAAFSSPEHLGTHLDAPIHFGESGWTNAEIPVERFFAVGIVIDMSDKAAADPDATLDVEDISAWEERNGAIPSATIVIVRTGWANRWPDWNTYYGTETPEDVATLHFPGISEAAALVLAQRQIAGVGIDTASIDPGTSTIFEAHRALAPNNIFNLENLTNVDGLPESGFGVIALPMKIAGGTGGPTRVVAVLSR